MLISPIIDREIIVRGRRLELYSFRVLAGLVTIVVAVAASGSAWPKSFFRSIEFPQAEAHEAAERAATGFLLLQGMCLIAAPIAGAWTISREKQKKTLQEVLTSRLTSLEIAASGHALAVLMLALLMLAGLPVLGVVIALGGVPTWQLPVVYAVFLASLYFFSAVGNFFAVMTKNQGEATLGAFLASMMALIGPGALLPILTWLGAGPTSIPMEAANWLKTLSPMSLFIEHRGWVMSGSTIAYPDIAWFVASNLLCGTLLTLAAAWQLRPAFRRHEGRTLRVGRFWRGDWRWRLLRRPVCGDYPLTWKDRTVSRTHGGVKLFVALIGLIAAAVMLFYTFRLAAPAFAELWAEGYGHLGRDTARQNFNYFLRGVTVGLGMLWVILVGAYAADGWTRERQQETWISLISTPLTGTDLIRGKVLGAFLSQIGYGLIILGYWLLGVVLGAVHPLGFAAAFVSMILMLWFLVASSTFQALWALAKINVPDEVKKAQVKARFQSYATLAVLGVLIYYNRFVMSIFFPYFFPALLLFSYRDVASIAQGRLSDILDVAQPITRQYPGDPWAGFAIVGVILLWSAFIYTRVSFKNVDGWIGRPFRKPEEKRDSGTAVSLDERTYHEVGSGNGRPAQPEARQGLGREVGAQEAARKS